MEHLEQLEYLEHLKISFEPNVVSRDKQLLDEVFVISRIIKVKVSVISRAEGEIDNTYRDLDNSGYHKNRIQ